MPEGLTFQSSNLSQGTYDPKTGIWSVGNIAAGQNVTLAITCMTSEKGAVDVPAAVTASDEPDSGPSMKSSVSVDVQARRPPPQPQAQQNMPAWLIPVGAALVLLVIVIMRR
jgi:large repetitive protein